MKLLDLLADASAALDQVALLLSAAVSGGIGTLLAGSRLYWRLGAKSVRGTVVGVRTVGQRYYAAYRYKRLPSSSKRTPATADVGVRASRRLITGREVRLLVFKKHPDRVAEAGFDVTESIGWAFWVITVAAIWIALTRWPVTSVTWIALAGTASFLLYRLHRSMPARGEAPFTSPTREPLPQGLLEYPIHSIEEILAGPVRAERQRKQRITGLIVTPVLVLVGMSICALGAYLGRTLFLLQSTGERVRGTVLFCELQRTLRGGAKYYSVVQFTTATGQAVQFRDNMGRDSPPYRDGEPVDVLYFPASARETAAIDRGWLDWVAPGALCVGGLGLAVITVAVRLWVPKQVTPPPPSSFR